MSSVRLFLSFILLAILTCWLYIKGGLGQSDIGKCSDAIGGLAGEFYSRNRQHYSKVPELYDNPGALPSPEVLAGLSSLRNIHAFICLTHFAHAW